MRLLVLLILGLLSYTSYYLWLKYPLILDKLFRLKDERLRRQLSRIGVFNIFARAYAIDKLMKQKRNQKYIEDCSPILLENYLRSIKYWYWSLIPFIALIVINQIELGYEMLFHPEEFRERVGNSWFVQTLEKIFK